MNERERKKMVRFVNTQYQIQQKINNFLTGKVSAEELVGYFNQSKITKKHLIAFLLTMVGVKPREEYKSNENI